MDRILIRVSQGTIALLKGYELRIPPYTAYLLQYSENGCSGLCRYCRQSRRYIGQHDYLSRVYWPVIDLDRIARLWRSGLFKRVCLLTILKRGFIREAIEVIKYLRHHGVREPFSVCTTPISRSDLVELKSIGVDRIGVGLDACSREVFNYSSKPYDWGRYIEFIGDSLSVFGEGNVTVHLIIGLGETLLDTVSIMDRLYSLGCRIALFPYTPDGLPVTTPYRRPSILYYRFIQIIRCLMERGYRAKDLFVDNGERLVLREDIRDYILESVDEFLDCLLTSGCPYCNRPYYNERVSGPLYNIPSKEILYRGRETYTREIMEAIRVVGYGDTSF